MKKTRAESKRSERERLLDEALVETFPASDPVSMQQMVTVGRTERPPRDTDKPAKAGRKA